MLGGSQRAEHAAVRRAKRSTKQETVYDDDDSYDDNDEYESEDASQRVHRHKRDAAQDEDDEEEDDEEEEDDDDDEEEQHEDTQSRNADEALQAFIDRIHYSERYNDDHYQYRHVILPRDYYRSIFHLIF